MEFTTALGRLERFVRVINRSIIGLKLFEAFLVIIVGVATSFLVNTDGTTNIPVVIALVVTIFVYLLCITIQIAYAASFPGSITEELKAAKELEQMKAHAERQRVLSELLVHVMQQLNSQTCVLGSGGESHLCSDGVADGVNELLAPLTQNINVLVGTATSNVLVGIYLEHYCSLNSPDWVSETFVLSDSLGVRELVPPDLMNSDDLTGAHLEVHSAILKSEKNFAFVEQQFVDVDGHELSIYCSPMPVACNEDSILGVLFIILPMKKERIDDLPDNLRIFGRVVANWVYRYNDCVLRRRASITTQTGDSEPRFKERTGVHL